MTKPYLPSASAPGGQRAWPWLLTLLTLFASLAAQAQATLTAISPAIGVAGTNVTLTGTNLTGATAVTLNGTNAPTFTVASATSVTVRVPAGATTGVFVVTTPAGTATGTATFTVQQPRAGRILLDGYRETRYGTAQSVQTNFTGFGNSTTTAPATANGSELDAAYTYVHGDSLYVFLGGNIQSNGNSVEVFFDSQTGGQNVLTATNPNVDGNGLNAMAGLTFDTGFTADYYLSLKGTSTGIDAFFASLGTAGVGVSPASSGTGQVLPLSFGNSRTGTLGFDQSNTGGVSSAAVYPGAQEAVVTGLEFVIPLAAIGSPTGSLNISAFVNGGSHGYLSSQTLGGLPLGTASLAAPATSNFASTANAGNQYFTVNLLAGAATITSFSPASGPVGTVVTITGTNFTGATGVSFGGTAATTFTVVSATSITATVPAGASTGNISVVTAAGTGTSGTSFAVTAPPTVTSFSPTTGVAGTNVTLTGTNFASATAVTLNGTAITGFVVNSATSISVTVPAGVTTGVFTITTPTGSVSSTSFTVLQPAATRILLDGYRETRYGAAQALQANATAFGNSATGTQSVAGGGSELDAAYTYVHGDSLYVFLAGNIENNGNSVDVFFDSQTGGQNVLAATNPNVDGNGLNAMAGLTFDTGFTADYFLSLKGVNGGGIAAYFASLGATGVGVDPASSGTGRVLSLSLGAGRTGVLAFDQSNTGGVDNNTAYTDAPAAVVTGLEFVIPLAAIGSPAGANALRISAFVNGGGHGYLSNQVLATLPAGSGNLAGSGTVNFASTANTGNQYFSVTLPVVAATITSFSPASGPVGTVVTITGTGFTGATGVSFGGTVATTFTVVSATSITVTVPTGASTSTISVVTPGGTVTSGTSFTVVGPPTITSIAPTTGVAGTAVTLNGTNFTGATALTLNGTAITGFVANAGGTQVSLVIPAGATTGTFSITTPNGTIASATTFTVQQPRAGRILLDGYRETRYGAAQALQANATAFGNSATGTQSVAGGGSELDAAYTYVHGDSLYVFLAGNIENNGNSVDVFFDSQTGGQNVLAATNPNVDGNGLNAMAGLTFDTGFTADYFLSLKGVSGGGVVDAYFASLGATGTGVQAATGTSRQVTLTLPGGLTGLLGVDQSNTGGVDNNTVYAGAPAAVVTGLEFVIPLAAIGSPVGTVNVTAFVNGGSHGYLSNQVLASLPAGTGNLAGPAGVNFASAANAGNQYFGVTIPAPVPTAVSFTPASGAVGTTVTITGTGFTGATSVSFGGTATTTFTVVSATSITVTVPAGAPAGFITVTTPGGTATTATSFCVQYAPTTATVSRCGAGTLTLTTGGAPASGTYAYYTTATGGTAIAGATGTSYTTPSLSATTTYYVGVTTGTGTNACEGPRTAITATINALPTVAVAAAGPVSFCAGGSVVLTASGATTYLWSSGQTTASITVSAAGSYSVTGTSAAGCVATSTATAVTVNPLPVQPTVTRAGLVLTSSATTGNQWYFNGAIIVGATGTTYTATATGNYTVITTSAAGCASPASAAQAVVLGTLSPALASQISVYPNPTQGRFSVVLPGTRPARLVVLNALGQQVLAATSATGTAALDLTGLARGVYAVRVELGNEVAVKRIVLE